MITHHAITYLVGNLAPQETYGNFFALILSMMRHSVFVADLE